MDGLKINIAGVRSQGQDIVTSAEKIGTILGTINELVTKLGSAWRDQVYEQAASEMNNNIAKLVPLQEELKNVGTQIMAIADEYEANKAKVQGMFQ